MHPFPQSLNELMQCEHTHTHKGWRLEVHHLNFMAHKSVILFFGQLSVSAVSGLQCFDCSQNGSFFCDVSLSGSPAGACICSSSLCFSPQCLGGQASCLPVHKDSGLCFGGLQSPALGSFAQSSYTLT